MFPKVKICTSPFQEGISLPLDFLCPEESNCCLSDPDKRGLGWIIFPARKNKLYGLFVIFNQGTVFLSPEAREGAVFFGSECTICCKSLVQLIWLLSFYFFFLFFIICLGMTPFLLNSFGIGYGLEGYLWSVGCLTLNIQH